MIVVSKLVHAWQTQMESSCGMTGMISCKQRLADVVASATAEVW